MKKLLKIGLIVFLIVIIFILLFCIIFFNHIALSVSLDDLDKSKLMTKNNAISIYDINNNNLNKASSLISITDLKDYTKNAFISIEDKDFYKHNGLNYKRIVKAVFNNIVAGQFKEGASTISQQLIKNTQLSNDKTIERKIKEMYITQELEKEFTKDEILEMYLNIIYFGNSAYGIQSASKSYFEKDARDLSIAESATLAGIIKSPLLYSPIYNYDNCVSRRNLVLREMLKDGYINQIEFDNAISQELEIVNSNTNIKYEEDIKFNYDYLNKALLEASQILKLDLDDIKKNEYQIYTYLDENIQKKCYEIINSNNYKIKNKNGIECQGLITIVDNKTNNIVAYCGNSNYDMSNLKRQPGSAIKPIIVYAPAFEQGLINPLTKINDEPIDIDGYKPNNVGNIFHGYVSVRDSVAYSYNIPAIKLMQEIGIEESKVFAENFGIDFSKNDCGYALALGGFTEGITLDKLVNAYTVFANAGIYRPCTMIKEIKNKYGITIYKDSRLQKRIIDEDSAYLITSVLQDGVKYGTSKRLNSLSYDIAGKTGTVAVSGTNDNTDAVSVAYTSDYSVGCWLGNYTSDKYSNLDNSNNGGTYATSAIKEVFKDCLYNNKKPENFSIPKTIQKLKINRIQYERDNIIVLADENIDDRYTISDYFSSKNLPENFIQDEYELELNVKCLDNNLFNITFNTKENYIYELYTIENNKTKLLKEFKNLHSDIEYEFLGHPNRNYIFYIKYKSVESKFFNLSNKVEIYTKDILDNNSNLDGYQTSDFGWLFS